MFLIRTAFWLGLVVLVLPTDERQQAKVMAQAAAALHWTQTFCDRNAQTCSTSQELWTTFTKKAQFGFELAANMIRDWNRQDPASPAGAAPVAPADPQALTTDDRLPVWRGPAKTRT
jgi:hypothetical protein